MDACRMCVIVQTSRNQITDVSEDTTFAKLMVAAQSEVKDMVSLWYIFLKKLIQYQTEGLQFKILKMKLLCANFLLTITVEFLTSWCIISLPVLNLYLYTHLNYHQHWFCCKLHIIIYLFPLISDSAQRAKRIGTAAERINWCKFSHSLGYIYLTARNCNKNQFVIVIFQPTKEKQQQWMWLFVSCVFSFISQKPVSKKWSLRIQEGWSIEWTINCSGNSI